MHEKVDRLKLSFVVHDLASNPIGRVIPIAQALRKDYDIEIVGFLCSGDDVYLPYRELFRYKTLRVSQSVVDVGALIPQLAHLVTGDIIVACKPLLTTLGPALLASRFGRARPLLLDVEDDEWIPLGRTAAMFVWRDLIKGWRHATAWKYTMLLHPLTRLASDVMVVSTKLQRRYGGTIVLHGPDECIFDPDVPELAQAMWRERLGLPAGKRLVLFAGLPQPHKGWAVLLDALQLPQAREWDLVLVGDRFHPDFARARRSLGERCHCLGYVPYEQLPGVMAAVDAVPVPSLGVRFARSQVSAKALDALAMKRALLASRVGDFPRILGEGTAEPRGWLHQPGDAKGLARDFCEVARNEEERNRRTSAGRAWFLSEASATVIRDRVGSILSGLAKSRLPGSLT